MTSAPAIFIMPEEPNCTWWTTPLSECSRGMLASDGMVPCIIAVCPPPGPVASWQMWQVPLTMPQRGGNLGSLGLTAVASAAAAPGKDTLAHVRRARGLGVSQAVEKSDQVGHLVAIKSGTRDLLGLHSPLHFRRMAQHEPANPKKGTRQCELRSQARSDTVLSFHGMTTHARLVLEDLPPTFGITRDASQTRCGLRTGRLPEAWRSAAYSDGGPSRLPSDPW